MKENQKVKPVKCTVRPIVQVPVGSPKTTFHSGYSLIDVLFPNVFFVEIGEIHLKNFYTASLTVRAKLKEQTAAGTTESKWKTCLKNFQLMSNPHSDQGAESYFTISSKQMKFALNNISKLRFVLRQPSPIWKEYRVEDITLYKYSINQPVEESLPSWLANAEEGTQKKREIKGFGTTDTLSEKMQQLWAMVEQCKASGAKTSLARYDVDGSYEINLLSYS